MLCPDCKNENDDGAAVCFNCGKQLRSPTATISRGSVIDGRYEVLSRLGRGGMGTVYKALDRKLDEEVALKVLRDEIADDKDAERRFLYEIKLARKVTDRNVCRIHEYGEDGSLRFISMELVEGIDLKRTLAEKGVPPPARALEIALQVGEGLQAIHDVGIVHRDLKTANLMLDPNGVVKLMDFGIAKRTAADATAATATGMVVGTPDYMSPEQARGEKVDARSDIYAFGIVVFELFSGNLPFKSETPVATILRHLSEPPPLDGPLAEGIPAGVRAVLKKALAKNPADRYSSVREMCAALVQAGGDVPTTSLPAVATPAQAPATDAASAPTIAEALNVPTVSLASMAVAPTAQLPAAGALPQPTEVIAPPAPSHPRRLASTTSPRVYVIAVGVLATIVGVGFWLRQGPVASPVVTAPAPPGTAQSAPANGVAVALNALPWARVRLRGVEPSQGVPELSEEELTTPCVLRLAEGVYEVEMENGGITPGLRERIDVRAGRANEFVFKMPDFDSRQAATRADRQQR